MSTKLQNYFNDGANCNVQAVLCLLKHKIGSGIEESWDDEKNYYKVEAKSYKEAIEYFKKAHKGKGSFEVTVIGESEKIKRIRL